MLAAGDDDGHGRPARHPDARAHRPAAACSTERCGHRLLSGRPSARRHQRRGRRRRVDAHSVKLIDTAIDEPGPRDRRRARSRRSGGTQIVDARFAATGRARDRDRRVERSGRAVPDAVCGGTTRAPAGPGPRRPDRPAGTRSRPRRCRARRDRMLFIGRRMPTFLVDASTAARAAARSRWGRAAPGSRRTGAASPSAARTAASRILDLRRASAGRWPAGTRIGSTGSSSAPTAARWRRRADDGRVLIWDLRAGERARDADRPHRRHHRPSWSSADGRTLYTGGLDEPDHRLGSGRGQAPRPAVPGPSVPAAGFSEFPPPLAISPSGRIVAAGRPDGGVSLHDARTLRHLRDLRAIEEGPVMAVEFSPDGAAVAVTGEGGKVELRDVTIGPAAAAAAARPRRSRRRRWRSRPTAAASRWRTSTATCGCSTWRPARSAESPTPRRLPAAPLLQPGRQDAGGRARRADRAARRPLAPCRRPPARQCARGDEGRWVRFSPDGRLLAVGGLRRATRSCGTWPRGDPSARR